MKELLIGAEIGGTKLQAALGTSDGAIVKLTRGKVNLAEGKDGILNWFASNIPDLLSSIDASDTVVRGIGVGFGGPIDSKNGRIFKSNQVAGWDDFELKAWFEKEFSLPSFIYNDSSAAGYGEYKLGSGMNTAQFFYTNIGSGIGGSLIIDGKLYDGQGFGAAEIGHTYIPDWTSQVPGADSKLEVLCSGWGIEARLRKPGYVPENSLLFGMCRGDVQKLSCKMLEEAVYAKDAFAMRELDLVAKGISTALTSVLCLFQPERIAVGGGVALMGEPLFERIRLHTKNREFVTNTGRYDIVPCKLGETVVINGVLLLAAEALNILSL